MTAAPAPAASLSPGRRAWRRFRRNRLGFYSLVLFSVMVVASLFAEVLSTDKPLLQHLLRACQARPNLPQPVSTLVDEARDAVHSDRSRGEDAGTVADFLLEAFQVGLVDLYCDAPKFAPDAGERPCVSPLVRLQIEFGYERCASLIPSLAKLDNMLARQLVLLLDGSRDRAAIRQDLAARMATIPVLQPDGTEACNPEAWWLEELASSLEDGLSEMARKGLLLA